MDQFDVLIVGAGVSGIDAACHLRKACPGKRFAILDTRTAIGGTWDLFRYPGIRSDSDMHTFGFDFKPWKNPKSIADGPSIREYVVEAAREHEILPHIRFQHRVTGADWSSEDARWTVTAERTDTGETVQLGCNFLFMCSGYYSYDKPYTPAIDGLDSFAGPVIHPQLWPEDLDYSNKRVAIIGSGATAMTLVPSMADKAAKVTMIQRSPTYVAARPDRDALANTLRKFLPEKWAYAITRFKNIQMQRYVYGRSRVAPEKIKEALLGVARKQLGEAYVEKHFTPSYNPWDQRLCLIPNGDLFKAIKQGQADVVTGTIARVLPNGVEMTSGELVEADVLITATGLNMLVLGGAQFSTDGQPVDFAQTWSYKGMMYSEVPNLASTFGYINASWTLRADLTSEWVCRVLNRMDELGVDQVTAGLRDEDATMAPRNWIEDFSPGYMARAMHLFPKQGDRDPWRNTQNYIADKKMVRHAPLEDGALTFGRRPLATFGTPAAGGVTEPERAQSAA